MMATTTPDDATTPMPIPRILHYCWFGPDELSDLHQRCIQSWRDYCPDFELKEWNEKNCPWHLPFARQLHRQKQWVLLSDLVRLHALHSMGGIYLDVDIELLAPLDPFLEHEAFIGFQRKQVTCDSFCNAVMGAEKGHPYPRDCMEALVHSQKIHIKPLFGVKTGSLVLLDYGVNHYRHQTVRNVTLLEKDVLYPCTSGEAYDASRNTEHTVCRHYWQGSWIEERTFRYRMRTMPQRLGRLPKVLWNRAMISFGQITAPRVFRRSRRRLAPVNPS